jgi:hypothetical protein
MKNKIKPFEVIEGNLRAVKDMSDFGGMNMLHLYIKTTNGYWSDSIQWMSRYRIQELFTTKLPKYEEN